VSSKNIKIPTYICFAALFGIVAAAGFTHIDSFDLWWHLKTGEVIASAGQVPRFDIFSYTAAGNEWINHEWLFQIFAWSIYSFAGFKGLIVMKFLLMTALSMIVFKTSQILTKSQPISILLTTLVIIAIADRFMERPFIFSLLFLSFFALKLHMFASGGKERLWILAPVTAIWINMHGGGILAPQIVFAFATGELEGLLAERFFGPSKVATIKAKEVEHIYIVAGLCLLACFITPFGTRTFTFPFEHLQMHHIMQFTQEWLPITDQKFDHIISQLLTRILIPITALSYIVGIRRIRISHLMLSILTALLLLNGRRFSQEFAIINLPIIGYNLAGLPAVFLLSKKIKTTLTWFLAGIMTAFSALALAFGIPGSIVHDIPTGQIGFGITRTSAPFGLIDFLNENNISGRIFNHMATGGLLINERWPNNEVFIDGRTPVYGDEFYRDYVMAFHSDFAFDKLDRKYEFEYLVFPAHDAFALAAFHQRLWQNPKWVLVYANLDNGFIYLRNTERFRGIIATKALASHPVIDIIESNGPLVVK